MRQVEHCMLDIVIVVKQPTAIFRDGSGRKKGQMGLVLIYQSGTLADETFCLFCEILF